VGYSLPSLTGLFKAAQLKNFRCGLLSKLTVWNIKRSKQATHSVACTETVQRKIFLNVLAIDSSFILAPQ
jgi:hypothetical protein